MNGKRIHKIIRTVWLTGGALFMLWMFYSVQAHGVDTAVWQSDAQMTVTERAESIHFMPQEPLTTGLLFYPGALIDPHAYAPLGRTVAEQGYPVTIIKLPWRTASFGDQEMELRAATQRIMAEHPDIEHWLMSGHSRGGAIAGRFAYEHGDLLAGLILIGTSLPKEEAYDLSAVTFPVTKIYATNDGLASVAEVQANAYLLPVDTTWVEIPGGNHAQFGYYGTQLGDNRATISREQQQALTVQAILTALAQTRERVE